MRFLTEKERDAELVSTNNFKTILKTKIAGYKVEFEVAMGFMFFDKKCDAYEEWMADAAFVFSVKNLSTGETEIIAITDCLESQAFLIFGAICGSLYFVNCGSSWYNYIGCDIRFERVEYPFETFTYIRNMI